LRGIKDILKAIFPLPFLKAVFLFYNKVRILTIDKIVFPEFIIQKDQFLIYRKGHPFRENQVTIDEIKNEKVRQLMNDWYDWTQEEFILVFNKRIWIEPHYGWGIVYPNRLLYYSLGISRTWFQPKPSLIRFLFRKNRMEVPQAISLRDTGEENYFHFYNDVLAKLYFLKDNGIDPTSVPIIISRRLWQKEYFQYYYSNSPFARELKWTIQDDQYFVCDKLIVCKPLTHKKALLKLIFEPLISLSTPGSTLKIFITRNKSRLRFIENQEEIQAVAEKAGLSIIDTDRLKPVEQIRIFSEAAVIVGIHGAGLMNMVFRRSECKVLEIFPPPSDGYLPFHYVMLANMMGFQYQGLIGERSKKRYSGGFYISPIVFEEAITELLSA